MESLQNICSRVRRDVYSLDIAIQYFLKSLLEELSECQVASHPVKFTKIHGNLQHYKHLLTFVILHCWVNVLFIHAL